MESFLLPVVLLLLVGRTLGHIFQRYGFQSLIGEVLAGILVGFAVIVVSAQYFIDTLPALEVLSQFGVIMLMLLAGLMTDYRTFQKNQKASIFIGAIGVVITFFLVFLPLQFIIGPMFGLSLGANLFIAAILSNTAIEICAGVLIHTKNPKLSAVIIGASFVDDIIAIYLIGLVSTMVFTNRAITYSDFLIPSIRVIAFLAISLVVVSALIEKVFDKLMHRGGKMMLTVTLIVGFSFAIIASLLGLHEVIGAYIAGLIIGKWGERIGPLLKRRIAWEKLKTDIDTPLRAIFGPLFFGFIGLSLVRPIVQVSDSESTIIIPAMDNIVNVIPLIIIILILALLGKIIGCGAGAKLFKFSNEESLALGCAMCGRGALELVLLSFGLGAGIIDNSVFTALVVITVVTVIVTPILYTLTERRIKS
ncbi:cation:proton antiporter [[Eubacterium] cellulosolvens]